jgi:FKBP-type peptidyl-prolyl cis-trans isomerase FkpA
MRKGFALLPLLVLLTGLGACAQDEAPPPAAPAAAASLDSEENKILYTLGVMIAQRSGLSQFELSDEEFAVMLEGFTDQARGLETKVALSEYQPRVNEFYQQRVAAASGREKEAGKAVLDAAAQEEGAVKTDSGAIYIEIEAGTGKSPGATDQVQLHYHGTLRDGNVFDSSREKGAPASFRLNQVVPCFGEGVQRMKVGGKAKLVCPPETAYGDRGRPGIPPGATLIFEVELLDILSQPKPEGADS